MRERTLKPALMAAIVFCSFLSFGQALPNENEFDKKYTPNQNSIFNNLLKKNTESTGSPDIEIRNSIKFYPTMTVREKIFLSYTADIGKGFALELGIGKAFGNDYLQTSYFTILNDNGSTAVLEPHDIFNHSEYSGSFPLLSVGAKIYFSGKAFDGGYIDFVYRYERMNYLLDPSINDYRIDGSREVTFAMNAGYFGFGYTSVSGVKNNFTHDFFVQLGFKYFKYDSFALTEIPIGGTTSVEQVYQKSTGQTLSAKILPSISMGYAFGFGF